MNKDLSAFISAGTLISESTAEWGEKIRLRVCYYLADRVPPFEYVSSVRAILFRSEAVVVVKEKSGQFYIIPGGRVESGENPEETLRREILEEIGWTIGPIKPVGFVHFHHLTEKPCDYPYPYPDFLWLIYTAECCDFIPGARVPDEYVFETEFRRVEDAQNLQIEKGQLSFLEAAMRLR